jgi:hypothetical protein
MLPFGPYVGFQQGATTICELCANSVTLHRDEVLQQDTGWPDQCQINTNMSGPAFKTLDNEASCVTRHMRSGVEVVEEDSRG